MRPRRNAATSKEFIIINVSKMSTKMKNNLLLVNVTLFSSVNTSLFASARGKEMQDTVSLLGALSYLTPLPGL